MGSTRKIIGKSHNLDTGESQDIYATRRYHPSIGYYWEAEPIELKFRTLEDGQTFAVSSDLGIEDLKQILRDIEDE